MTKSEKANADITALLRARNTLLWIVTREETRVERAIVEAAGTAKYDTLFWDCAQGFTRPDGLGAGNTRDPVQALGNVANNTDRRVWVFRDLTKWFDPVVVRTLRNLAKSLQSAPREAARSVIILTPDGNVPPDLAGHAVVLEYPLPERPEMAKILSTVVDALPEEMRADVMNGSRDAAIDAAMGLSAEEASSCYAKSLVTTKKIDANVISKEKQRVIARERVLTWTEPDPRGLDAVGGLEILKAWLLTRQTAFTQAARDFGLPAPKGVLLIGVPGCGKSLCAKAIASAWRMPLLRADFGALKSKWVGESEANFRRALAVAETVAPCVLWVDEIEKALGGATSGAADGGVSQDALGTLLSWMQDRAGAVFVIATANDVSALPPELLRKGRFDEIFFVDVPTPVERLAILRATLKQHGRNGDGMHLHGVVAATEGFTGAEIAAIVPEALFTAFGEQAREVTTEDMCAAAETVVPLTKTAAEKIGKLREWAGTRARPASKPEVAAATARGTAIDI